MGEGLLYIWLSLLGTFSGVPLLYYCYMKRSALSPWKLKTDNSERPSITILIPTYNEEETIRFKMENLLNLKYPKELIQIIVVDSASTDRTVDEISKFVENHPEFEVRIIREKQRTGKSAALNRALEEATGEVVVVSDADCFFPHDILEKALPYLADPTVGAVAGQETLLNPNQSWVTKTEATYRKNMFCIQLGESKLYSTIQFEGGFTAYKRSVLDGFDCETGCDDSGTALNIVQKKSRTIVVPEALFFTFFPTKWIDKIVIKLRRAHQLLKLWVKCLKLLIQKKLVLPKRITLSEISLFLINPVIFLLLILATILLLFEYPILVPAFAAIFALFLAIPNTRYIMIEIFQNNFILLAGLVALLIKTQTSVWKKGQQSRKIIDIHALKRHNLI